jgi:preprotein translocase subunit SecY
MANQDNMIPEWRLNRTADELRDRAKRTMIIGAGVVGSIITYASAVRDLALPLAVLVGGIVLMVGTRRWTTADVRAVRELSSPAT